MRHSSFLLILSLVSLTAISPPAVIAAESTVAPYQSENLVAWCIVPFDAKKRGPVARVEMLKKLGFQHYAYDWRAEHLPTFGEELDLLKQHSISLTGVWFPTSMNDDARTLLATLKSRDVKTQLWVTGGGGPTANAEEQSQRIAAEVARLKPIAAAAAEVGCTVGLYNHGGWFGVPENQLAIIDALMLPNVGIIYNQHHGHDDLDRFAEILPKIKPHLYCLNLNGMDPQGDRKGRKILPLGVGTLDKQQLTIIQQSGYRGLIGILGHTQDDAEARLQDNLDGLAWLLPQLAGKVAGPTPKYRTYQAPAAPGQAALIPGRFGQALDTRTGGVVLEGNAGYRTPPLTVELWAKLSDATSYNILIAHELKSSGTHWELFSMPGTGRLSAYLPGYQPDHIHSSVSITDDQWHQVSMTFEPAKVRLFVDGKPVAEQAITRTQKAAEPGGLAIGQLVDRAIGCRGVIDSVRISRGVRSISAEVTTPFARDADTLGLWQFDTLEDLPKTATPQASNTPVPKPVDNHWGRSKVGFDWAEQDSVDGRWNQTDVGPFLAGILPLPGRPPVRKGLSIRVGSPFVGTVGYDTETLQWRGVWTGGFLKFNPARYGLIAPAQADGTWGYHVDERPGWRFTDAGPPGRLQHQRLDQQGQQVALRGTLDGVALAERPSARTSENIVLFTREFQVGPSRRPLAMVWGELGQNVRLDDGRLCIAERGAQTFVARLQGDADLRWVHTPQGVELLFPASETTRTGTVTFAVLPHASVAAVVPLLLAPADRPSPATWPEPQPGLWNEAIVTQGVRTTEDAPYVLDTLTLPFDNPYRALMFVGGHDFFANGDVALCTVHGDVWRVSGVDDSLARLTWKRFATGLFQPLGLKIVDDHVYVLGRDQITRLVDVNGDGAADHYEVFCNRYPTSAGGHDYSTGLEHDKDGNWFYADANLGIVRITADGASFESIATGLRNPNGLGLGPDGQLTVAPQEGEWTPASAVYDVRAGRHFGYKGPQVTPQRPLGYDLPICWIPRRQDNSSGGQTWVPGDQWGPFSQHLINLSFGQCRMLPILQERVDGVLQGAALEWPLDFESGVMRGRVSPRDGQLYVSGMKGWVTSAVQDGCLQRVRYTGKPFLAPIAMQTYSNGLAFTFSQNLAPEAEDPQNYRVQRWDYQYGAHYGSPEYRNLARGTVGREEVDVLSATILADRRTLFFEIDGFRPAMQYAITGDVPGTGGLTASLRASPTIHHVPERRLPDVILVRKPGPGRLDPALRDRLQPGLLAIETPGLRRVRMAAWSLTTANPTEALIGWIELPAGDEYRFGVEGTGVTAVRINGDLVWSAREGSAVAKRRGRGFYPLRIEFESAHRERPVGRLLWSATDFAEEPVPPTAVWFDPRHPGWEQAADHLRGRFLIDEYRCRQCHELPTSWERRPLTAPSLKSLRGRITPEYLRAKIMDPAAIRNDSRMPALLANDPSGQQTAADLAAYLLSEPATESAPAEFSGDGTQGEQLWEELGCLACHRMTPPESADETGRVSLGWIASKSSPAVLRDFLIAPSRHFPDTRMPNFHLTAAEASALAAWLHAPERGQRLPIRDERGGDAGRGKAAYATLGCARCHDESTLRVQPSLFSIRSGMDSAGCLAEPAMARLPRFYMPSADRNVLQQFVAAVGQRLPEQRRTLADNSLWQVERLRCGACHSRDHETSPRGLLIAEESDRGVPPETLPSLTWAGEKFRSDWTSQFLSRPTTRPLRNWLKARMPTFSKYAASEIATGWEAEHGLPITTRLPTATADPEQIELGRRLTLTQGGLDCRQCHAIGGQLAAGDGTTQLARGIDFEIARTRLRSDFYHRFVLDPPRFDLATRMPRFAPDGKRTKVTTILDGDARAQFTAIWAYLQSLPERPAKTEP